MSRKHFTAVAAAFKSQLDAVVAPGHPNYHEERAAGQRLGIIQCAHEFANIAINDNPRFDTQRFLRACGIN